MSITTVLFCKSLPRSSDFFLKLLACLYPIPINIHKKKKHKHASSSWTSFPECRNILDICLYDNNPNKTSRTYSLTFIRICLYQIGNENVPTLQEMWTIGAARGIILRLYKQVLCLPNFANYNSSKEASERSYSNINKAFHIHSPSRTTPTCQARA